MGRSKINKALTKANENAIIDKPENLKDCQPQQLSMGSKDNGSEKNEPMEISSADQELEKKLRTFHCSNCNFPNHRRNKCPWLTETQRQTRLQQRAEIGSTFFSSGGLHASKIDCDSGEFLGEDGFEKFQESIPESNDTNYLESEFTSEPSYYHSMYSNEFSYSTPAYPHQYPTHARIHPSLATPPSEMLNQPYCNYGEIVDFTKPYYGPGPKPNQPYYQPQPQQQHYPPQPQSYRLQPYMSPPTQNQVQLQPEQPQQQQQQQQQQPYATSPLKNQFPQLQFQPYTPTSMKNQPVPQPVPQPQLQPPQSQQLYAPLPLKNHYQYQSPTNLLQPQPYASSPIKNQPQQQPQQFYASPPMEIQHQVPPKPSCSQLASSQYLSPQQQDQRIPLQGQPQYVPQQPYTEQIYEQPTRNQNQIYQTMEQQQQATIKPPLQQQQQQKQQEANNESSQQKYEGYINPSHPYQKSLLNSSEKSGEQIKECDALYSLAQIASQCQPRDVPV
eukprot:Awhi_evm1s11